MTYFEQGYIDGLELARVNAAWLMTLSEEDRAEYHRGSKAGVNQRLGFDYHKGASKIVPDDVEPGTKAHLGALCRFFGI